MDCEKALERMMKALDGELPDEGRRLLEAHLETCEHCQAQWGQLQAAEEVLRHAPALSPPPGFVGRVMARVDRRRARRRAFFGSLALAAGTAIVLFIGFLPILWRLPGWAGFLMALSRSGDVLLSQILGAARLLVNSLGLLAGAFLIRTLPLALCSLMTALLLGGLWWSLMRRWRSVAS
ncbi:MAG: zf-HC2 domain-containing protein [Thermoflexales bacterium]|nr:zf-HC2 domain-containing protein [Thermoflexales bacterium]